MEYDLIFARCFLLREQNWTQVGWLKIPHNIDNNLSVNFPNANQEGPDRDVSSLRVFNCTFKHFVNHQLKFLLNNFNYSGVSVDKQVPKHQVINLLCETLIHENISRIYCHISLVEELKSLIEPVLFKYNKRIIILPSPPVERVYISDMCINSPNHNNVSCVKCILNNLYNKIVVKPSLASNFIPLSQLLSDANPNLSHTKTPTDFGDVDVDESLILL